MASTRVRIRKTVSIEPAAVKPLMTKIAELEDYITKQHAILSARDTRIQELQDSIQHTTYRTEQQIAGLEHQLKEAHRNNMIDEFAKLSEMFKKLEKERDDLIAENLLLAEPDDEEEATAKKILEGIHNQSGYFQLDIHAKASRPVAWMDITAEIRDQSGRVLLRAQGHRTNGNLGAFIDVQNVAETFLNRGEKNNALYNEFLWGSTG
jgi:hypothetical protein